jgi:hypothetical protein
MTLPFCPHDSIICVIRKIENNQGMLAIVH